MSESLPDCCRATLAAGGGPCSCAWEWDRTPQAPENRAVNSGRTLRTTTARTRVAEARSARADYSGDSPARALEALAAVLPDLLGRAGHLAPSIASTARDERLTYSCTPRMSAGIAAACRLVALYRATLSLGVVNSDALLLWGHYGATTARHPARAWCIVAQGLLRGDTPAERAGQEALARRAIERATEAWDRTAPVAVSARSLQALLDDYAARELAWQRREGRDAQRRVDEATVRRAAEFKAAEARKPVKRRRAA